MKAPRSTTILKASHNDDGITLAKPPGWASPAHGQCAAHALDLHVIPIMRGDPFGTSLRPDLRRPGSCRAIGWYHFVDRGSAPGRNSGTSPSGGLVLKLSAPATTRCEKGTFSLLPELSVWYHYFELDHDQGEQIGT